MECKVRDFHSKIFVTQGRLKTGICHYHSKLVQWQGRVKTGNLSEFRKIKHFFDENDKNGHRVGNQSNTVQQLENLPQQIISHIALLKQEPDGGNEWIFSTFIMDCLYEGQTTGDFQENLVHMMTNRRFQTIFKEISFRNSIVKPARNILLLKKSAVMYFIKFVATYFYENCVCYGINQDQTQKLAAAGIDTRRQYCAT